MTRYCLHCTLCGERGSDGEPKNRTWDEVGGPNYVLGWVIDISHRNLSSAHRLKASPPPPSQTATLDHWHRPRNMCVWFYQKTTPFSGNVCLFSWHVHSYLIGIAFPVQQLSICFATKMHLYSTDSFSQSPLSRIYQHSNVQGFYISHAQGCSQTCTVWLFCRKDRAVFIFLFSIVC